MRKFLKLISALTAVVIMLTMVSATGVTYEVIDDAIYISTATVPEDATAFALDKFSHLSAEFVASLGFTYDEACSMRVGNGFCAYSYGDTAGSSTHYYYPVLVGNEIVALITVSYNNGKYSFCFGADEMASALNEIQTSSLSPVEVVVSDEAFYGIVENEVYLLSTLPNSDSKNICEQMDALTSYSELNSIVNITVVSQCNVYSETVIVSGDQADSSTGKLRSVAIVNNALRTEDNYVEHGTCWASCTASLYCYYAGYTSSMASNLRDDILKDRYASDSTYYGGIYVAKSYLEDNISGVSLTVQNSSLTWSEIKSTILTNDAPCYTKWDCESGEYGHAMVLCGYYYESTYPNDSSYYYIRVMNPNKTSYQSILYGDTYPIGDDNYSWAYTLVKN